MRHILTAVEKWDAECPGLRADIERMFARGVPCREICRLIKTKYRVLVRESQLWQYREKVWSPSVRRIERYTEMFQGILRALAREGGLNLGALWDSFIGQALANLPGQRPALGMNSLAKTLKEHSN
jgi:hypothetical protein